VNRRSRSAPKAVLRSPDLDQAKSAVLNRLSSPDAQRGYRHAIDEFIDGTVPSRECRSDGASVDVSGEIKERGIDLMSPIWHVLDGHGCRRSLRLCWYDDPVTDAQAPKCGIGAIADLDDSRLRDTSARAAWRYYLNHTPDSYGIRTNSRSE
jgi:hypothetical protein